MISNFKHYLAEVLDNPYEFTNVSTSSRGGIYEFETDMGVKIQIDISIGGATETPTKILKSPLFVSFCDENGICDMLRTGYKEEFRIMATVKKAVELSIKRLKGNFDGIAFSADEDDRGRIKLYTRFSRMLASELGHGYEIQEPEEDSWHSHHYSFFVYAN